MRSKHLGVRQLKPHIHQHSYGDYLGAVEKIRRGKEEGLGGSQEHSVRALDGCCERSESVKILSSQWASRARADTAVGRRSSVELFGHHHA